MTQRSTFWALTGALAIIAAFAILLAASIALVFATLRIERISNLAAHFAAAAAELIFGTAAILAAVYIATSAVVRIFSARSSTESDAVKPSPASHPIS